MVECPCCNGSGWIDEPEDDLATIYPTNWKWEWRQLFAKKNDWPYSSDADAEFTMDFDLAGQTLENLFRFSEPLEFEQESEV